MSTTKFHSHTDTSNEITCNFFESTQLTFLVPKTLFFFSCVGWLFCVIKEDVPKQRYFWVFCLDSVFGMVSGWIGFGTVFFVVCGVCVLMFVVVIFGEVRLVIVWMVIVVGVWFCGWCDM
jgi:hypothetical protein